MTAGDRRPRQVGRDKFAALFSGPSAKLRGPASSVMDCSNCGNNTLCVRPRRAWILCLDEGGDGCGTWFSVSRAFCPRCLSAWWGADSDVFPWRYGDVREERLSPPKSCIVFVMDGKSELETACQTTYR
jgi:hypothetical protein